MNLKKFFFPLITAILFFYGCDQEKKSISYSSWEMVGGNPTGNKYSSLDQINIKNVNRLKVAWIYNTGDADTLASSQIQCNPIIVQGVMYCTSPRLNLLAIDAATGKELWKFQPFEVLEGDLRGHFNMNNNRGVAYWTDGKDDERIFYATGHYMNAVDAKTGKLIQSFGNGGRIDLHEGLGRDATGLFITATSAPSVYQDLLLTGTRVAESMDAAPGHIRAYDVRTGEQKWIFHTIPEEGQPGAETWEDQDAMLKTGGANNWMGMIIDHERGIAFAPTGSAAMDFYGGKRKGSNLYSNCLLALDAATGKLKWYFQYIHHDTWDYDPSSYPVLVTVERDGKSIDAVAQTSKTGFVYLFDRETGESLFPIDEIPMDTVTDLEGEKLWPTQPIPQLPAPFVRQEITETDINPYLPKDQYEDVKSRLEKYGYGKMFTPQSKKGTIIFPGLDGGSEWGGPAVDPESNILYVNANEMPWIIEMLDSRPLSAASETYLEAGKALYRNHCMVCHGEDRSGTEANPDIRNAHLQYDRNSLMDLLNSGRRMMPSFQHLSEEERMAIISYVGDVKEYQDKKLERTPTEMEMFRHLPYNISGYNKFKSKEGLPAIAPPWGTLTAINLNSGEHVWQSVLGEDEEMKRLGAPITGTENYGGPVVTKGGLIFIAATKDSKFRAFNKHSGELLWEADLPASGFATPSTYELNGRQYIVIACGGGKLGTKSGDAYVAFALGEE
ncbi:MAG TPA: PQQ-binding-like beta-propeller repeat protein [Anditalea sp.]|nr:PQQ-binding-like beta-propeller repeat protein [Anditalea sp.]